MLIVSIHTIALICSGVTDTQTVHPLSNEDKSIYKARSVVARALWVDNPSRPSCCGPS